MRLLARVGAVLAVVAFAGLASAPAASAHVVRYGDNPSNWRSAVTSISPAGAGITATLGDGGQRLTVSTAGTTPVQVLDAGGRPYLRLDRSGAWLAQPAGGWTHVSTTPSWTWHDQRTHWPGYALPPQIVDHQDRTQQVLTWTIPLRVNGTTGVIAGSLDWVAAPNPAPWGTLALVVAVAGAAIGFLRRWRRALAAVLLAVVAADVAHAAAMVAGRVGSLVARLGALPGHGVISLVAWAGLVGCALQLRRAERAGALYVANMLLAVVFLLDATPSLGIVWRSQAVTALPVAVDRVLVAALCGACLGLFAAGVLLLRRDPPPPSIPEQTRPRLHVLSST